MAHVLSPQEQRIQDEIEGRASGGDSRIDRLLARVSAAKPHIDVERAKYFTESMRETEGQALILRWAKAMHHVAERITLVLEPDELIVGRGGTAGRYGILYPELDGDFLAEAVEELPQRQGAPFTISAEDARTAREEIAPYWQGKTFHEDLARSLPAETLRYTYNPHNVQESRFIVNETASFRSSIQWVHDYEKVLQHGLEAIRGRAQAELAALDPMSPTDTLDKKPYLEAVVTDCEAVILLAHRYAALARKLAAAEKDDVRRMELEQIAERCAWVPEHPARNFREALQSQWFIQLFSRLEQKTGTIISNGRMDQYLYPFYQADKAKGILSDEDVLELLACVWIDMAQYVDLYISPTGGSINEGYAHWEAVTIGGQTRDGRDAVNELTYLFLRSKREFPLHYPDLAARICTRSPERYLYEVAETIKDGCGFPKLINDEEVIPLLLAKGARFSEAYDYAVSGCSEARMPNRDTYTSPCAYINFPAALEMTLLNGRMRRYGEEQIGPAAGNPLTFDCWEKFWQAYLAQHINFLKQAFIQQKIIIEKRPRHFAWPLGSLLHDLSFASCRDIHEADIPGGIDLGYFEFIGYATVVDSLAAVKKLVYEEKRISMQELLDALQDDFQGHDITRQLLLHAPKYGNDDHYADAIARELDLVCLKFTQKYSAELGVQLDLRYVPFTSHVPFGKVVSATPNGRHAFSPLSDGASASQGADMEGPTAVLLSNYASKNAGFRERASRLLNIKFSPACVAGEAGTEKLMAFIRTWCDLKLWHVQFNVINKETLLAAKREPEKYQNLIVRIAGYSAYFVDLSEDLQNDLIARTEHAAI